MSPRLSSGTRLGVKIPVRRFGEAIAGLLTRISVGSLGGNRSVQVILSRTAAPESFNPEPAARPAKLCLANRRLPLVTIEPASPTVASESGIERQGQTWPASSQARG